MRFERDNQYFLQCGGPALADRAQRRVPANHTVDIASRAFGQGLGCLLLQLQTSGQICKGHGDGTSAPVLAGQFPVIKNRIQEAFNNGFFACLAEWLFGSNGFQTLCRAWIGLKEVIQLPHIG